MSRNGKSAATSGRWRSLALSPGGRRASHGIATNALSSVGNLALTLVIAHRTNTTGVGRYAVAFSIYAFVTALVRAGITESVLSSLRDDGRRKDAAHEVSVLGLAAGVLIAVLGVLFQAPLIVFTGLAIHGMLVYDFVKTTNMALLRPAVALRQEVVWTSLTLIAGILGLLRVIDVNALYAAWALSGAIVGYAHARLLRVSIAPRWPSGRGETRLSGLYTLDQLMGQGAVQVTTYLLAAISRLDVVGSLRAAGTFFSPITIVSTTGRSIAIPHLTRMRAQPAAQEWRAAGRVVGLQLIFLGPLALATAFVPLSVCRILVGQNATACKPLLFPLALEAIFNVAATVAFAGHRAHRAGMRSLIVYSAIFPLRVGAIVVAAAYDGAHGAAWAMVAVALVSAVVFWWSYHALITGDDAAQPEESVLLSAW